MMDTVWQDVKFGLRTLRRGPGYAAVIVATLALGIGANTAIFSVIDGVLLEPLPYTDGDRLVVVRQSAPLADVENLGVSVSELRDYRAGATALTGLVEYHGMWFNLLNRGEPERVQTGVVSANFFDLIGVQAAVGRTFLAGEDEPGAEPVLVLSHGYWQRRFGGDPGVVGQTVEMNDRIHTIVGVLPPVPQFPRENDVYMPSSACPFRSSDMWREHRAMRALTVFGRLRPGVTVERATSDLATVAARFAREDPQTYPATAGFRVQTSPLREELTQRARPTFLVLLGTAGFVLLIACANVANLTLARLTRREQEIAVRTALGAGRVRLVRQLVTESTMLALAGGVLGLALAAGILDLLVGFAARFTPRAAEVGIDGTVLLFTLAVACGTGILVGTAPAFLFGRDVASPLREGGGHATGGVARQRFRNGLVVTQLAFAFVLLIGAGLMIRSFVKLQQVDPGFDPSSVLTLRVDLDWATYTNAERRGAFFQALHERVGALPGVVSSGLAGAFPLDGGLPSNRIQVEGRDVEDPATAPRVAFVNVSPGYFETLRIPVLQGRTFTSMDHRDAVPVGVINRTMARHFWPDEDPVGRRVSFNGSDWITVVGVVGDVKHEGLDEEIRDQLYVPLFQQPLLGASVLVRTRSDPLQMARTVTDVVRRIDPRQPVAFVRTLAEVRRESLASPRLTAVLLGLLAALAFAVTATGIMGLVAFSVSQRTHEIGIRLALGARPLDVVRMVVRQGMSPVLLGLALGIVGAVALSRFLARLLFDVAPTDPLTFALVSATLAMAAALACYLPARRVAAIDPVRAFRAD